MRETSNAMLYLPENVQIGKMLLIAFDPVQNQPVFDLGTGMFTLSQIRRAAWDRGEDDAFTEEELKKIEKTVEVLR